MQKRTGAILAGLCALLIAAGAVGLSAGPASAPRGVPVPGTMSLYITKDGWDPSKPLTWSEINPTPFTTVTNPPSVGDPGSISSYYFWNATLPAGKTGYHVIYSVMARTDSTETFYGCSDVMFDGGNGEVTGIGATAPPPTETPCTATYSIVNSWQIG